MERDYGHVPPYLEGETVFVIGGGPSLTGFEFEILQDYHTIGANDSGLLSGADVVVTLDHNYHRNRTKEMVAAAREGRTVYSSLSESVTNVDFPPEITHLRFKRGRGLSSSPDMLYGLNSGFAALNVAYLAGATDIRLLGFDFKFPTDQKHWHAEYDWFKEKSDHQIRKWARDFDLTISQLEASNVKVTNYIGPEGSSITAYGTRSLKDLLK